MISSLKCRAQRLDVNLVAEGGIQDQLSATLDILFESLADLRSVRAAGTLARSHLESPFQPDPETSGCVALNRC